MFDIKNLEIFVKAICPVIAEKIEAVKQDFAGQLVKSEQTIEALKAELAELKSSQPELVTIEQVKALIPDVPELPKTVTLESVQAEIKKALAELPEPKDGQDASLEMVEKAVSVAVKTIELPKPPTVDEVAATFERRFSDLVLSWERQARDVFEKAVDKMPLPKDGKDAIELEAFEVKQLDDGRTIELSLKAGDTEYKKTLIFPVVIERGVYSHKKEYQKADGVTYGGSYWIAQKDAPEGAPGTSGDWRLAVKKGRDGRDLRDNASTVDPTKGVKI